MWQSNLEDDTEYDAAYDDTEDDAEDDAEADAEANNVAALSDKGGHCSIAKSSLLLRAVCPGQRRHNEPAAAAAKAAQDAPGTVVSSL